MAGGHKGHADQDGGHAQEGDGVEQLGLGGLAHQPGRDPVVDQASQLLHGGLAQRGQRRHEARLDHFEALDLQEQGEEVGENPDRKA